MGPQGPQGPTGGFFIYGFNFGSSGQTGSSGQIYTNYGLINPTNFDLSNGAFANGIATIGASGGYLVTLNIYSTGSAIPSLNFSDTLGAGSRIYNSGVDNGYWTTSFVSYVDAGNTITVQFAGSTGLLIVNSFSCWRVF
jgi:hypothetical protein